ncbi:hypothetical protein HZH66_006963 [Vespula vulgaris]|uniref:Uncharacterized protein n=1 Tax=Vespula vulgaris TaxID=7454 RepID=A0A834K2Y9_VESVU|nr:hypothetical protein HZH66_006963 [Vespula vulgaris]
METIVLKSDAIKKEPGRRNKNIGRRNSSCPDRKRKTVKKANLVSKENGSENALPLPKQQDRVAFREIREISEQEVEASLFQTIYRGMFTDTGSYSGTSAYHTTSTEALCVVAGKTLIDLQFNKIREFYSGKKNRHPESKLGPEIEITNCDAKSQKILFQYSNSTIVVVSSIVVKSIAPGEVIPNIIASNILDTNIIIPGITIPDKIIHSIVVPSIVTNCSNINQSNINTHTVSIHGTVILGITTVRTTTRGITIFRATISGVTLFIIYL